MEEEEENDTVKSSRQGGAGRRLFGETGIVGHGRMARGGQATF